MARQLPTQALLGTCVQVKLRHEETKAYLSSSANHRYGRPIAGQLEICAKKKAGKGEEWMATEGLYFPQRTDAE
jgi:hypothetical protein